MYMYSTCIHTQNTETRNMSKPVFYYYSLVILYFFVCTAHKSKSSSSKTYIVHVTKPDGIHISDLKAYHESFLPSSETTSDDDQRQLIHSYKHVISGFSANLTPDELESLKTKPGFISAMEETILHPHTTHSPDFLGLHFDQDGFWKSSNYGQGVIIGVLDTGILPNHPSFDDNGMPPPPKRWKGKCDLELNNASLLYHCNNKLIGARRIASGPDNSVLDYSGHGTHTASTAGGNFVANASVKGNGLGTAAGIAPRAHLAIYKICFLSCGSSDILAGLDAAIEDGVDVISLSLGSTVSEPFHKDVVAIGSFAAMQKGVLVICAAGNLGPGKKTLANEAPWILTVGASTMDRSIRATAKLGDGQEFDGESTFQPPDTAQYPLVYAPSGNCRNASLEGVDVKGKIVLCDQGKDSDAGTVLKNKSASGMIIANNERRGFTIIAESHPLPATEVSFMAGEKIKKYINSTKNPTAAIAFKGTVIGRGDPIAPAVASFSSRGPSTASPGILKPDIIGPGVNVLAAWPFSLDDSPNLLSPKFEPTFNFLWGTSMACPHLSGVAALLKSAHPDWSPTSIKSAIMTTADIVNMKGQTIVDQAALNNADVYGSGSGHVNPFRANDPGLVYDMANIDEYVPYLCGLKDYTEVEVGMIVHKNVSCATKIREGDLNYPTFTVVLGSTGGVSYVRTVTNVGMASSSYSVNVVEPKGVTVSVVPQKLEFKNLNEKLSYNVTFTRSSGNNVSEGFTQGYLEWLSGKYVVRSMIVATFA